MTYLMALDQGTTSSRAIIFDHHSRVVASAQQEYEQLFPQPAWVEHRPQDIWTTQSAVAERALQSAQISSSELAGLGICNQRETSIIWEKDSGDPVYNAIVWQDRRTAEYCESLRREGVEPLIQKKNRAPVGPILLGNKTSLDTRGSAWCARKSRSGAIALRND